MKGKHIVMLVLMALVAVFGAVGYAEEKKKEAQTDAAQTPPPEVAVADVVQKDVPVFQDYVASMDGLVNATILAQVEGYLIKQNYQEGSFVKKGALLFEIDPRPFQASLDVAKAVLAKHEAVLRTAQATLKRILPLAEARAVSQKD
ncbi:MAG: biotin/lipoyl-binding protein, partial [Desulfobacteraceae bacterium]|nr:biotin/lipoyl-binding protein [Desulfobacteraceae bacterium]